MLSRTVFTLLAALMLSSDPALAALTAEELAKRTISCR